MKIKVLFLRANNTSPRVFKEALSLEKQNYDVHLLLWNRVDNSSKTYRKENISITEYGFRAPYGNKVVFYWIFWWLKIFRYLLRNNADIVHVCGLDSYIPVVLLKNIKKYKVVYDIFDFLGDSLPTDTPNILRKFVSWFERFLAQFADKIIIVDECRRDQISNIAGSKIEVIMNCVDDSYPKDVKKCLNEQFTIFYGGMLSKNRGLYEIITVIKNEPGISLVVAGSGEDEKLLLNELKLGKNITFLGHISHEEALYYTFKSDLIFAFYNPEIPINRLASPNKLFEAMMCRTPVIVNCETSMAKIIYEVDCGLAIPYNDQHMLREAILKLKGDRSICEKMGDNGRFAFETQYNWAIMEHRLQNLYSKIIGENDGGINSLTYNQK